MLIFSVFLSSAMLLTISILYTTVLGQVEQVIDEGINQTSLSDKSQLWNENNMTFLNETRSNANETEQNGEPITKEAFYEKFSS